MTLAERYAKLEPRERTLLGGLAVAVALILFFVVPAYGSGSLTSRLPRHRDGTNSGMTMAMPTRASTPSKSKASKPVP